MLEVKAEAEDAFNHYAKPCSSLNLAFILIGLPTENLGPVDETIQSLLLSFYSSERIVVVGEAGAMCGSRKSTLLIRTYVLTLDHRATLNRRLGGYANIERQLSIVRDRKDECDDDWRR